MNEPMPLDDLRLEQIRDDATGISEEYMTPSAYQDDLRDVLAEIDRLRAEVEELRKGNEWLVSLLPQGWGDLGKLGRSSEALVRFALGGNEPTEWEYPMDLDDIGRCNRAYASAPEHLKARMEPILMHYRSAVDRRMLGLRTD